jgi:hypothetical protein
MTRHISGTYQRTDRVRLPVGETVRLRSEDFRGPGVATLLELSPSDLLLSSATLPAIGSAVSRSGSAIATSSSSYPRGSRGTASATSPSHSST